MTGSDPLDFEILRSIPRQLQHLPRNREDTRDPEGRRIYFFFKFILFIFWFGLFFLNRGRQSVGTYLGSEVLEDGGAVDCSSSTHSPVTGRASLQVSVDPAHWELGWEQSTPP